MINVVLLVHNRPTLTAQALDSLWTSAHIGSCNLTIVDDGSGPETRNLLRGYVGKSTIWESALVRIEPSKNVTGFARNLGIHFAEKYHGRGELLYLSDNDCYFAPGWLDALLKAWPQAERIGFGLVGLSTHPYHGVNDTFLIEDGYRLRTHDAIGGLSQSMRWETWDEYGPYDAHARGTNQSEDWAFCRKLVAAGLKVGTLWPYLVANCGLTDSFGKASPGSDDVRRQTDTFISHWDLGGKVVVE